MTAVDLGYYMPAFAIPAARDLIADYKKFGVMQATRGVEHVALRNMVAGGLVVPSPGGFVAAPGIEL